MKKMWKRVLAIATAMLILAGMLPTAVMGAAEGEPQVAPKIFGSVTINKTEPIVGNETPKPVPGAEFSFYKILSVTPLDAPGVYAEWELENELYKDTVGDPDNLGNYDAKTLEAKYAALQKIVENENNKIEPTKVVTTNENGQAVAQALTLGWYLVLETEVPTGYIAGKPFMVAVPSTDNYNDPAKPGTEWIYDITVQPKNQAATIDKAIIVDNAATSSDTVGVNDVVNYQLNTTMPTYDDSYSKDSLVFKINDTMSAGLTFKNNIKVTIDGVEAVLNTDYTMETNLTDNKTFEIIFKSATIAANMGKAVVVNYSATVNEDAVVGNTGNTNTAKIVFENAPGSSTSGSSAIRKVYTFDILLNKKGESNAALAGAEFKIYSDAACTTEVTDVTGKDTNGKFISDAKGKVSFGKLDAGTYYLKEVKSPAGYTLLTNPIKIEIIAGVGTDGKPDGSCTFKVDGKSQGDDPITNGIVPVNVVNHKGFTLPATGGMGTYLFTIGGLILMAGAVVLLIAMKKKKA